MLKVLIADDEARILSLIRLLPDWDALGMEVVGTACNGLEALALVQQIKPDILITDIRMPGCQGLELIEKARQIAPEIEIVIISGYAHFEYAQTAIKLGVGDYLLKPIKKDELTLTLGKLGERCRNKQEQSADDGAGSREARMALREKLVREALDHRPLPEDTQGLQSAYCFGLQGGAYQAFVLKLDHPDLGREPLEIIDGKVREQLKPLWDGEHVQCAAVFEDDQLTGLLCMIPGAVESVRKLLRGVINHLEAQKALFGKVSFSVSLSAAAAEPAAIPSLLEQAIQLIDERLLEGTGRLLEGTVTLSGLREERLLERYGHETEKALSTLDVEHVIRQTNEMAHEAMNHPGVRGCELRELVRSAGRLFSLRLGLSNAEEAELAREIRQASRADELFECLVRFEKKHMNAEDLKRRSEELRPIRIAKQYVQAHSSEPITLEDVCAATGFSVSYFSALFKKETGEGFSKYLTGVRMERAKELLQESDLPVAEVCVQVGYSDIKHFTQTFKKHTNLTPAQYRKLYG